MVAAEQTSRRHLALLIEDDVAIGSVVRAALVEEGFQVVFARHVLGVREVARLDPDVFVLDLVLDGRDTGWELLQALAADAVTARIPVVVCTGDEGLARREANRLGELAASVLLKPFTLDAFDAHLTAARLPSVPDLRREGSETKDASVSVTP